MNWQQEELWPHHWPFVDFVLEQHFEGTSGKVCFLGRSGSKLGDPRVLRLHKERDTFSSTFFVRKWPMG